MGIHKEGRGIITKSFFLLAAIIIALFFIIGLVNAFIISAIVALIIFFIIISFFRSPKRTPITEEGAVIAPADGRIVIVKEVYEDEFLKCNCIQVSVFMSLLDVHVNWFPVSGQIKYYKYHPGRYIIAMHPKSSDKNERTSIVIEENGFPVLFRQIAGFLARRIVCYAVEGREVKKGSEMGFIKFGSRVDLFLPMDSRIQVTKGQKVKGCQTVIARLPELTEAQKFLYNNNKNSAFY